MIGVWSGDSLTHPFLCCVCLAFSPSILISICMALAFGKVEMKINELGDATWVCDVWRVTCGPLSSLVCFLLRSKIARLIYMPTGTKKMKKGVGIGEGVTHCHTNYIAQHKPYFALLSLYLCLGWQKISNLKPKKS